jgi:hypothetical protein
MWIGFVINCAMDKVSFKKCHREGEEYKALRIRPTVRCIVDKER